LKKTQTGYINVGVANLYREGNYRSEIVSQALLAEKILIEEQLKDFSKIRQTDDYSGWISNYQWVPAVEEKAKKRMVRAHHIKIYAEPDITSRSLRDATIGVHLPVCRSLHGWLEVILPDTKTGWVKEKDFSDYFPATRQTAVKLAEEFYGIPYFWGGRSAKGFDCSGFIQTIFALIGRQLPRDSWMQQRDGTFVSTDPKNAQPGDLYFFSDNGKSITHVGIAAGNSQIIHARGMVRLNSLKPGEPCFNQNLLDTFIDVRTYF
jgi:hypothetical protein